MTLGIQTLGVLALLLLLAAPIDVSAKREPRVYLLSFNRWGDLLTPLERDLAARELAASPEVERIILLAYGWNNDRETAYESYLELLDGYEREAGREIDWSRTTVIAIGWDSWASQIPPPAPRRSFGTRRTECVLCRPYWSMTSDWT